MNNVRTWYFGSYCGVIMALNDTDEEEIDENDDRRFVLESDYILLYNEMVKLKESIQ